MGDAIKFETTRLQKHFDSLALRYNFEGVIGRGFFGCTFMIRENHAPGPALPAAGKGKRKRGLESIIEAVKKVKISPVQIIQAAKRKITPPGQGGTNSGNGSPSGPPIEGAIAGRDVSPDPNTTSRRLCLKRALGAQGVSSLRTETQVLREVNGAAHIVRLIAYRDDSFKEGRRLAKLPWPRTPPDQGDFLAGLIGPVLVTEFLPNGTLARVIERLNAADAPPTPNRVLWALYSCVVRACIGMAYPARRLPSEPPQLETIPRSNQELAPIVHGDVHVPNVMFGNINPSSPEHRLIPIMKLIDFGESSQDERLATGPPGAQNIFDTARLIYNLIRRSTSTDNPAPDGPENFGNIRTRAVNFSDQRRSNRAVDMDLQHLICAASE
ncbi:hypothetical protein F5Y18DRAFT_437674 [Xylariaceae sp. FL1019]|nr:hypothetical protein F5Y18DRAFT_437674 [Xylariaceae sp. FL1019]